MAFAPIYFDVKISSKTPTDWTANTTPKDGFLYDIYPQQINPPPTTKANGLAKSRAKYRWNYMMNEFAESVSPTILNEIVYSGGTPPYGDNTPQLVEFTLAYDRPAAIHTTDESGTYSGMAHISVDPANRGSGYEVGDVLTAALGTGTKAVFVVGLVDGTGAVLSADVQDPGSYTALPTAPCGVTGGTGTGAKFFFDTVTNPGLYGARAVKRWAARALLFSGTWNFVVFDPTATNPVYPTTVTAVARNPLEILPLTIGAVAANLTAAEGNITVTVLENLTYILS